jgi:signal transduction histidine kinase/CheY-like chemotaxis protein
MSIATAVEFLLLTIALGGMDFGGRRDRFPAQMFAVLCSLTGFIALLGYLYDVHALYAVNIYSTMALHTAALFVLLGAGVLLSRPDKGFMASIASSYLGGAMARSMLPVAIGAPVIVGYLRLVGQRLGWYDMEFGLALFATCTVLLFAWLIVRNARTLNKADHARSQSDATIELAVSELRATMERLKASEELHRLSVEAAGLGTWRLDAQSGELICSDICLDLYGLERGATVTRQRLIDAIHKDDRSIAAGIRSRVESGTKYFDGQYRVVRPGTGEHWITVRGQGYFDQSGRLTSIQGIAMDTTKQKADEADRERLQAQLRQAQKLNSLGTLAAGIAHDFNNVLTAIVGNARLARDIIKPDNPAVENLSEIDKATQRASDLVRRILTFGRAQDGNPIVTQMQPIVEETIKLLRASVPALIEFRTRFGVDVPNVFVDATQIHQVIMNLTTNAAHAIGSRSGLIEIELDSTRVTSETAFAHAELHEGNYVRLAISDDGCGMDSATIEQIFEPFYTTKAPGKGSGLGLSVAHGIVKNAGGAITVYSQPNKGTKFHIYLPASDRAVPQSSHAKREPAMGNGERVLYIDDEEALVFLMTRSLERKNYHVSAYTDVSRAIDAFCNSPGDFHAVVTDLSMPQKSGFDVVRELRRVRPDIPVIMTSGYVRREDMETARELGISELISKPNTVDDLAKSLARLLAAARNMPSS